MVFFFQLMKLCLLNAIYIFQTGGGYNVKLAFKSVNRGESLWRAEAVREMCEMDERLVLGSPHVNLHDGEVCPSHSIGYYIGLLNNKECRDITNEDMNTTSQVISIIGIELVFQTCALCGNTHYNFKQSCLHF